MQYYFLYTPDDCVRYTALEYYISTTTRHRTNFYSQLYKDRRTTWFGKLFLIEKWKSLLNIIAINNIVPVRSVGVNNKATLDVIEQKIKTFGSY